MLVTVISRMTIGLTGASTPSISCTAAKAVAANRVRPMHISGGTSELVMSKRSR